MKKIILMVLLSMVNLFAMEQDQPYNRVDHFRWDWWKKNLTQFSQAVSGESKVFVDGHGLFHDAPSFEVTENNCLRIVGSFRGIERIEDWCCWLFTENLPIECSLPISAQATSRPLLDGSTFNVDDNFECVYKFNNGQPYLAIWSEEKRSILGKKPIFLLDNLWLLALSIDRNYIAIGTGDKIIIFHLYSWLYCCDLALHKVSGIIEKQWVVVDKDYDHAKRILLSKWQSHELHKAGFQADEDSMVQQEFEMTSYGPDCPFDSETKLKITKSGVIQFCCDSKVLQTWKYTLLPQNLTRTLKVSIEANYIADKLAVELPFEYKQTTFGTFLYLQSRVFSMLHPSVYVEEPIWLIAWHPDHDYFAIGRGNNYIGIYNMKAWKKSYIASNGFVAY